MRPIACVPASSFRQPFACVAGSSATIALIKSGSVDAFQVSETETESAINSRKYHLTQQALIVPVAVVCKGQRQ